MDFEKEKKKKFLRRVNSTLRTNELCHILELERRTGEVGIGSSRIEPRVLHAFLKESISMKRAQFVRFKLDSNYYSYNKLDQDSNFASSLYISKKEAMTKLIKSTIKSQSEVINLFINCVPINQNCKIIKNDLTENIDFIIEYSNKEDSSISCGIKIFNQREWIYQDSAQFWLFLSSCYREGVLPIIIARQISWQSFYLFKLIGALGICTYKHYVDRTQASNSLDSIKLLGFTDITHEFTSEDRYRNFFEKIVPSNLSENRNKFFKENISLLAEKYELCNTELSNTIRKNRYIKTLEHYLPNPTARKLIEEYY